jgi:hypothetical protein
MYDNGTKQTMRGWTWNRVCDFIPKPMRKATNVVYLSGPHDFDRRKAISNGFVDENILAVDRDKTCVESVRRNGGLAIAADLTEVLLHEPFAEPPGVIIADLVCGFSFATEQLFTVMCCQPNCVIAMNLQRGRDVAGGEVFSRLNKIVKDDFSELASAVRIDGDICDWRKHRGLMIYLSFVAKGLRQFESQGKSTSGFSIKRHMRACGLSISSYKSKDSGNMFDSLVLKSHSGDEDDARERSIAHTDARATYATQRPRSAAKLRRRLAAFKAVRTMKINALRPTVEQYEL